MRKAFSVLLATAIFLFPKGSDALRKRPPAHPWRITRIIRIIRIVDASDTIINPADTAEWNKEKKAIFRLRDSLQQRLTGFWRIEKNNGLRRNDLSDLDGHLCLRIQYLNRALDNMAILEKSGQHYGLKFLEYVKIVGGVKKSGEGLTYYDSAARQIKISYDSPSTANFVHELTHAGQFETQDLAFDMHNTKYSLAQDWKDEVDAYKGQFAYDPISIPGLSSPTFNAITKSWLISLRDTANIYGPGGTAKTGQEPVTINTPKADMLKACPDTACRVAVNRLPEKYTYKSDTVGLILCKQDKDLIVPCCRPDPACH